MKTSQIALRLYILSSVLAVIATVINNDLLILLAKPTVIPAIYYYYLTTKTTKTDWLFVAILILNFIGDTIVLLKIENETLIIMVPYFFSYVLLLTYAYRDVRKMKYSTFSFSLSVVVFFFLMYVMYGLIQLFADTRPELIVPVIVYGLVLGTFGCMAVYCYTIRIAAYTFYLLMVALTSIVSDVFYMMFNFTFHIPFFNYFEFAIQLISYYFIVKYVVLRKVKGY